jgi:hypothetical protein
MPSISIAMSLRGQLLNSVKTPVSYVLFIPSGSDSLITADSLTFKVRE